MITYYQPLFDFLSIDAVVHFMFAASFLTRISTMSKQKNSYIVVLSQTQNNTKGFDSHLVGL